MNRNRPSRGGASNRNNRSDNGAPRHPRGPQARDNQKSGRGKSSPSQSTRSEGSARPSDSRPGSSRPGSTRNSDSRPGSSRPGSTRNSDSRPGSSRPGSSRPGGSRSNDSRPSNSHPGASRSGGSRTEGARPNGGKRFEGNAGHKNFHAPKRKQAEHLASKNEPMRLNRFLSVSGICSRREADTFIQAGLVTVNGKVVTELGVKVKANDLVKYNGEEIRAEKKVYLVLNKPKGFITTMDDPRARKTVMDLVGGACSERIYPVGRLDRATTGVLLFTNDGDMAKKLTHPSHGARKIYHVTLDKNFKMTDFQAMTAGLELEDGLIVPDDLSFTDDKSKREIGIELHSGKNHIVRRMFEHLGYEVIKLDRTSFAGLTKKGMNRGHYRFLREDEVRFLMTR